MLLSWNGLRVLMLAGPRLCNCFVHELVWLPARTPSVIA
jgi:hypothetical protein